ncbi:MAG: FG-GAP-like repeat-containing protein, partial [Xanthomonadales bacterium]
MYGQADIGFVADAPKDGTTVPANPETPPAPAPRPDFTIDPESASVGATQGVFDVDAHGAATYRIPLTTAPGAGGLAPELALQYNSQAPNDVAGVGWSIAGLSAITRCPQTFEQDGVAPARGVALDREDRFCLDGQRLMVVAGTYGVDGAEYRTEIDGFQRIRSFGAAGSGPAWFRVWHGDGSFSDYGATDDARIVARTGAHAGTALSWAISRHEDGSGNFIEYRYDQASDGPVEAVLERVRYTGNRRAGTAPYAELRFAYTDGRGDVPLSWLRGVAVARDRLLVRVDSLARVRATDRSMVPLRSLFLDYGQDGFGRRVLASVTECSDPDRDVCFAPTRFEWLKNEHTIRGVDGYPVGALFERDFRGLNIADVNGDGFNDLLIVEGRKTFTFSVAFADEHGRFRRDAAAYPLPGNGEKREPVQMLVIDLDADGRQDVVYPRQTGDRIDWVARLAGPNGFGAERIVAQGCCERRDPRVARIVDFNGDGLADLLTDRGAGAQSGQGDLVVLLNALEPGGAPGFAPPRPIRVVYDADLFPQDPVGEWALLDDAPGFAEVTARTPNAVQAFDFNGDGAVDLLARIDRRYVRCDTSCNTNAATVSAASDGQQFDFDGSTEARGNEAYETVGFYIVFESDGLDRYVQRHVVATDAESGCTVSVACEPWAQLPAVHQLQAVDINGDGLADLAWRDSRNDWWFRVNTGAGFAAPRVIVRLPERDQSALGRFADLGGDGFPEFLYPSATDRRDATWIVHTNDLGAGYGAAEPSDVLLGNHAGGDISLLYDFNGDGATDNLLLDFRNGVVDSGRSALYPGVNRFGGSSHQAPNVLQGIRDGAGRMTRLHYRPMTDPVTYTRRHDAVSVRWGRGSPVFDLLAPLWLVAAVDHSAPTWSEPEALDTTLYHYAGARVQAGRGFLGFAETVRWRPQAGLRINTRYRQDFPFVGVVADVTRSLVPAANGLDLLGASRDWPPIDERTAPPVLEDGARLIGHAAHDWRADANDFGAWHRRTVSILERSWSPEGELLEKTLATHEHDAFGRISRSSERTWAAEQAEPLLTVTTRNTHLSEQDARWMLHRLANVVVEHRRPGQPTVTRASAFAYDPETGRRVREVTEPGDAALEVVTTYRLDAFGNPVETTVAARDVPPRVSRMAYDSLGRFAVREINAYGQVRMQVHEWNAAGTPLTVADIDGVLTYSAVDPMGRVFANWTETGRWGRTVRRHGAGPVCPAGTAHHLHTVSGGEPDRYDCFDSLGRVIRSARPGFDGRLVFEDTAYDGQGRRERVSEPYFQGDARYWNRTVYDAIGRTVALESAAGDDFERDHGSAAVHCGVAGAHGARTVNSAGQARLELRNVLGELVGVIDSLCGRTDYRYDAVGNLVEVTGIDGTSVRMRYDGAGRRIAMDDPDKGHWQYAWNGLGELVRQRDAKGQALDYRYDDLGRVIQRLELRGVDFLADTSFTVVNTERTVWQNSSTENVYGKGQPLSVTYREGVAGAVLHQRQYRYDEFGRQVEVLSDIGDRHFSEATTWDRYGRIFQQFDASGDARGVRHVYNAHGYLEALREAREGAEGRVYSTILSMSERGRITAWRLGNGVEAFADFEPASGKLLKLTAYDA